MKRNWAKGLLAILVAGMLLTGTACDTQGVPGEKGEQGEQGIQGEKGEQGEAGKGISDIQKTASDGLNDTYTITFTDGSTTTFTIKNGAQGEQGEQGEQGIQGDKGDQGEQGIQGEKGEQGIQGDKGDQGEQGIQGEKGEQGELGISVVNAYINDEYHLIIILSNGEEIDAGYVGASSTPAVPKYTVVFVDHDGTELKKETVKEGEAAIAPAHPAREGYYFVAWDKDFTAVTGNMTVTAQYQKLSGPTLIVNPVTVEMGDETVEVVISVLENPGIASLKFDVTYDERFTLTSVAFDPAYGSYVTAPTPYKNPQSISLISPLSSIEASGKFVTLTFKIAETVTVPTVADIRIVIDDENVFDENFDEVTFTVVNGQVVMTQ